VEASAAVGAVKAISQTSTETEHEYPPVSPEEMLILRALWERRPETVTQEKLAGMRLDERTCLPSVRTVAKCLQTLEGAGLVHRPKGRKKGSGLTPEGESVVQLTCR